MNDSIKNFIGEIHADYKDMSWTHPRTLLLLSVITDKLGFKNFTEIGTWLGAVPIMTKKLESYFGSNQLNDFVLVENFQDHVINNMKVVDGDSLTKHINDHISDINIKVHTNISDIDTSIDVIHFDSVKYQRDLLKQFDALRKYFTPNTLYIFDDYIAEWPDVIHCVDAIADYHSLEMIGGFGPKVYLGSKDIKEQILAVVQEREELLTYLEPRHTVEHGLVIGPGRNLVC